MCIPPLPPAIPANPLPPAIPPPPPPPPHTHTHTPTHTQTHTLLYLIFTIVLLQFKRTWYDDGPMGVADYMLFFIILSTSFITSPEFDTYCDVAQWANTLWTFLTSNGCSKGADVMNSPTPKLFSKRVAYFNACLWNNYDCNLITRVLFTYPFISGFNKLCSVWSYWRFLMRFKMMYAPFIASYSSLVFPVDWQIRCTWLLTANILLQHRSSNLTIQKQYIAAE